MEEERFDAGSLWLRLLIGVGMVSSKFSKYWWIDAFSRLAKITL